MNKTNGLPTFIKRQKNYRLLMLKAFQQELLRQRQIGRLAIKLAISIKERRNQIQITNRGLPYYYLH